MPPSSPSKLLRACLPKFLLPGVKPGVHVFALVGGLEAVVRGSVLSLYPLLMYRAWGDASTVAQFYFLAGLLSLLTAFSLPLVMRRIARNRIYAAGVFLYGVSACLGLAGGKIVTLALLCHTLASTIAFVCFNAYVLDHVAKTDFSRLETLRLLYGGLGWTVCPVLGVWLLQFWHGAPFLIVLGGVSAMLATLWHLRLGSGLVIGRRRSSDANPFAHLRSFFFQPRLVAGWFFPVVRSCGWWIYIVYVGIFAIQSGLGEQVGGAAASLANLGLFLAPLMLRWMQHHSLREAVRTGFLMSAICFTLAALASPLPWVTVALLVLGAYFLVLLDVCGGLPFMMSVKPSQRADMSAVYSSFRDVSGILSPALVWVMLQFTPVAGAFAAGGLALLGAWYVAGKLHPELGVPGSSRIRS